MARCKSCGTEVSSTARFCSSCGATLPSSDVPTMVADDATALGPENRPTPKGSSAVATAKSARSGSKPSHSASSSALLNAGRFLPGSILAERYRIVALLGQGGMGEVYRADDLTLGQPVALKFLPEEAAKDPGLLERFRGEVRISRKVSHPNVCRVYDVGEVDGQTFFTMEYVDGEDLASLLRRIGRLPNDKAIDIARQLCAGLAAAHAKGVLHRDLKPANIMLDGRGQAVITDFGLAALTEQAQGAEVRSGTPAYMAPEQLSGKEVTERSDIYSLGLVLYEIFTGKRAFSADSLGELLRSRSAGTVSRPSSFIKDMDPLVERVIMHCVEADPALRPASALAVAAALPGGDPLAAALAAGETPSPQMVAAAGQMEGMRPRTALICIASCVLALFASVFLLERCDALLKLPLDMPPDVLTQKARDVISSLGYSPRATDSASDFDFNSDLQHWIESNDKPRPDWDKILAEQPSLLRFIYRQSPRYMLPLDLQHQMTPGVVTFNDPAIALSGMINLKLDINGKLVYFQCLPPEVDDSAASNKPANWDTLFSAAGLDRSKFQPVAPQWVSLANSDERAAWTGQWPGSGRPLRVEAAAWHGKPVYFQMIGPWTRPARMRPFEPRRGQRAGQILGFMLFLSLLGGAAALARRHYKQGKGDRTGAIRVAAFVFLAQIAIWLCYGHFVPSAELTQPFVVAISTALFNSALCWLLYMALEPYVRKLWPQTIISWTRLISGRIHDPLVGRDIMFGVMLGISWVLMFEVRILIGSMHFGSIGLFASTDYLLGGRSALGAVLERVPQAIQSTLVFFILLVTLRFFLRNRWLAAAAFVAVFTALEALGAEHPGLDVPLRALIYIIAAFALVRFGLITLAMAVFTANVMLNVPVTFDFSHWFATTALAVPLAVLALGIWAFYTALGGQKLFKEHPEGVP